MLNESYAYKVQFAHDKSTEENLDIKHGVGLIDIVTDEPIKTQEQLKEVARSIGMRFGFTSVAIVAITNVDGDEVVIDEEDIFGEVTNITSLPKVENE